MIGELVRTDWINVGGGFGPDADEAVMAAFMRNALVAADFLRDHVQEVDLGHGSGTSLQQVLVVFEDHPEGTEYEVSPVSEGGGTRVYRATSHWLTDEYADERSGPWSLLAVLCGILVSLHREAEIDLPRLPWSSDG